MQKVLHGSDEFRLPQTVSHQHAGERPDFHGLVAVARSLGPAVPVRGIQAGVGRRRLAGPGVPVGGARIPGMSHVFGDQRFIKRLDVEVITVQDHPPRHEEIARHVRPYGKFTAGHEVAVLAHGCPFRVLFGHQHEIRVCRPCPRTA